MRSNSVPKGADTIRSGLPMAPSSEGSKGSAPRFFFRKSREWDKAHARLKNVKGFHLCR